MWLLCRKEHISGRTPTLNAKQNAEIIDSGLAKGQRRRKTQSPTPSPRLPIFYEQFSSILTCLLPVKIFGLKRCPTNTCDFDQKGASYTNHQNDCHSWSEDKRYLFHTNEQGLSVIDLKWQGSRRPVDTICCPRTHVFLIKLISTRLRHEIHILTINIHVNLRAHSRVACE